MDIDGEIIKLKRRVSDLEGLLKGELDNLRATGGHTARDGDEAGSVGVYGLEEPAAEGRLRTGTADEPGTQGT